MAPSSKLVHYGLLVTALLKYVSAECPNACSGHGDCGNFDMCNCWRNWMGNDCSERICPFSLAHVDLPKGDLNMDNTVSKAEYSAGTSAFINTDVAKYHPMYYTTGTAEKFPFMSDESADAAVRFADTAHYYAECSNKGLCDRDSGECECFEGYEGSACQRASCPNQCSGHGTCESIRELAEKDHGNIYELWDRDATYGCDCDPGYYGADCSLRYCKYGVDPLYYDDEATIRTNSFNLKFAQSAADKASGTFGVKFYDVFDEDYVTDPVLFRSGIATADGEMGDASTTGLKDALLGLPNTVIEGLNFDKSEDGTTLYYKITFTKNPGKFRTPEIDIYLNGNHGPDSSTIKVDTGATLATSVETGALGGEFKDYFYSRCEGITVQVADLAASDLGIQMIGAAATLVITDTAADGGSDLDKLKKCLGDSNGETSDNVGIYNWDEGNLQYLVDDGTDDITGYGVGQYPHAIKLVEKSPGDEYEGGHFYLTYLHKNWDADTANVVDEKMVLLSNLYKGDGAAVSSTDFYVYTTDVVVKMVYISTAASAYAYPTSGTNNGYNNDNTESPIYAQWTKDTDTIYTSFDSSCERMNSYTDDAAASYGDSTNSQYVYPCLQKGDYIMLPDGNWGDFTNYAYAATPTGGTQYQTNSFMDPNNKEAKTEALTGDIATDCTGCAGHLDYSGHIYEIKKIWTAPATANTATKEDRFRIKLDKPVPWDGSTVAAAAGQLGASATTLDVKTTYGINPIFKFDVATKTADGNYPTSFEYVSECSNKGICNAETGVCECFKGYTKADCGTQSSFAV